MNTSPRHRPSSAVAASRKSNASSSRPQSASRLRAVTPDRTARGSGNWDPNSFLSREDMEAEIGQLKKSVAQLQEEKLRLKTSHVRMELEMAKAVQAAGDFQSSGSGSKGSNMVLALRKKLLQTERALGDKAQEVEALKQDARVVKTSELEREKAVLLSEVKRLMQVVSTLARSVADANTSLASLPDQAAMASQNKTLQQECAQLKKHLQEVIAERDKAVADNVRIVSDSRSMMASAVEKALVAREKLITGDGISARSAAQIRIDDLEKTNHKLQSDIEHSKAECKRSAGEVQRLKIRVQHLEGLIAAGSVAQAAAAVSFPPTSDKTIGLTAAPASKPIASPSTLQELSFNCKHYSKSFLRTVVKVPFAISWPDFLKRLRDEFPGVCGCTYVHNDSVAVISNFRQFEQACERVEDAFIAGSSDGSLEILVIDDAAALATISGTIPKHSSAVADSAASSHRPQSATSRPGSASSRPQSATSRGSNATPRSEFVVQNVSKQEQKSSSRPESARLSEVEAEKISESEYVSEDFESDDAQGYSARGR